MAPASEDMWDERVPDELHNAPFSPALRPELSRWHYAAVASDQGRGRARRDRGGVISSAVCCSTAYNAGFYAFILDLKDKADDAGGVGGGLQSETARRLFSLKGRGER